MTAPPVSLGELRAHINTPAANHADDEELWRMLLAATDAVETEVGALEVRAVTERIYQACEHLTLGQWPVLAVASVDGVAFTNQDQVTPGGEIYFWPYGGRYWWRPRYRTVVYTVGRDPVPDKLREATLVVATQLWESQRGPVGTPPAVFAGAPTTVMPRGFALPNKALELMAGYRFDPVG